MLEQDAVIRELLTGQAEDGHGSCSWRCGPHWNMWASPGSCAISFCAPLNAAWGPGDLERLGAEHGRPMWSAAGEFLREYERVQLLSAPIPIPLRNWLPRFSNAPSYCASTPSTPSLS